MKKPGDDITLVEIVEMFLDPALGDAALIWIEDQAEALQRRRQIRDKLLYLFGYIALALGVVNALSGLFA